MSTGSAPRALNTGATFGTRERQRCQSLRRRSAERLPSRLNAKAIFVKLGESAEAMPRRTPTPEPEPVPVPMPLKGRPGSYVEPKG